MTTIEDKLRETFAATITGIKTLKVGDRILVADKNNRGKPRLAKFIKIGGVGNRYVQFSWLSDGAKGWVSHLAVTLNTSIEKPTKKAPTNTSALVASNFRGIKFIKEDIPKVFKLRGRLFRKTGFYAFSKLDWLDGAQGEELRKRDLVMKIIASKAKDSTHVMTVGKGTGSIGAKRMLKMTPEAFVAHMEKTLNAEIVAMIKDMKDAISVKQGSHIQNVEIKDKGLTATQMIRMSKKGERIPANDANVATLVKALIKLKG